MAEVWIKERDHHAVIKGIVMKEFPELSNGAAVYAANKICNDIRASGQDCYNVEVSRLPMPGDGYYRHLVVECSWIEIHVRVTVD